MQSLALPITVQYIDEYGAGHVVPGAKISQFALLDILGFSKLVNLVYPVFGYFGIIQMFYILKQKD